MATIDVAVSAARPVRRRWYWLLVGSIALVGGLLACEGWAALQEHWAAQALADDRMDAARHHIELALRLRGRQTSTLLLAARIRRLRGGYSDAEQYLFRCGQYGNISESVQLEWLLLRCQQGEVGELAPNLLALTRQNHPQSCAIYETLASIYLRQTRYLESLLYLNRWLELDPDAVRALDWRGWVGNQLDHRPQAIRDYEHLLQLHPQRADIRLRLGQVLLEMAHYAEAAPHLERLLVETPNEPDVPVALASCRIAQGRTDEARSLLDAVLKDHPDHFDALFQRGKLELDAEHFADAEPWLRKALEVKPHDKEARYKLSLSLRAQPNRQQEAERELARWDQEGKIQDRLSSLLRKDLGARPNDVDLACEAGELFLKLDEEKRGLFWLYHALKLNPRHLPSHRALLAYYERTNNTAKAHEQRQQIEKLGETP